ncbi:uncharacterized protein LODBEIA_P35160 [Lodderomyces beijingensis]|uniref:Uncharacterized protein n=1 Tax=Lodderomyces beijingensis TaxID=1775926 RepID=A0ABP0ZPM1_9ASCO
MPIIYFEPKSHLVKREIGGGYAIFGVAAIAVFCVACWVIVTIKNKEKKAREQRSSPAATRNGTISIAPASGRRTTERGLPAYNEAPPMCELGLSQRGYDLPSDYVPAYSAEAGASDMGFYDQSGKFVSTRVESRPVGETSAATHYQSQPPRSMV